MKFIDRFLFLFQMNPPDAHEEIRHLLYCSQRLRSNISRTIEEFRETYSQLLQILQEAKSKNVSIF